MTQSPLAQRVEAGFDEPTVIARRPIGPSRAAAPRRPPVGGAPAPGLPERPGAAGPKPAAGPPATPRADLQPTLSVPVPDEPRREEDVLAAAATALLVVVAQLRGAVSQADVEALRTEVVDQMRRFEERAIKFGAKANDVSAARYALCSLIDETVMTTPWGSSSGWSTHSLLLEFHGETWGGEKVFTIIDRIRAEPQKHLALFKLLDLCLLLGFEGKYRVLDNGREHLAGIRLELGRLLLQFGQPPPRELSPVWRGVERKRQLRRFVPLWVAFSLSGIVIFSSYALIKWKVSVEVAPVAQALAEIVKF